MSRQGVFFFIFGVALVLGAATPVWADYTPDICGVLRSENATEGFDEPNIPYELSLDWGKQGPVIIVDFETCCGGITPARADVVFYNPDPDWRDKGSCFYDPNDDNPAFTGGLRAIVKYSYNRTYFSVTSCVQDECGDVDVDEDCSCSFHSPGTVTWPISSTGIIATLSSSKCEILEKAMYETVDIEVQIYRFTTTTCCDGWGPGEVYNWPHSGFIICEGDWPGCHECGAAYRGELIDSVKSTVTVEIRGKSPCELGQ